FFRPRAATARGRARSPPLRPSRRPHPSSRTADRRVRCSHGRAARSRAGAERGSSQLLQRAVPGFGTIDQEADMRAVLLHLVALARARRAQPIPAEFVLSHSPRAAYLLRHFRAGECAIASELIREVHAVAEFLVLEE